MRESPRAKPKPRRPQPISEVIFHTYPKLIFVWPLIVAGYLFALISWVFVPSPFDPGGVGGFVTEPAPPPVQSVPMVEPESARPPPGADNGSGSMDLETVQPAPGETAMWVSYSLGWAYVFIAYIVVLTIGVDIERNHAIFWVVLFVAVFLAGMVLQDRQVPVLSETFQWFARRDMTYAPGVGLVLSILLTPPYVAMLIWARLQYKWRITHNEFEHYAWGRADDSLARGAKRVRSTYPDLFELLLCGSGTLIVYSATGQTELRRIPHVPMIFLVRRRINELLESKQVTVTDDQHVAELEAEEVQAEEEEQSRDAIDDSSVREDGATPGGIGSGRDPL